jgi:hypothetical protein
LYNKAKTIPDKNPKTAKNRGKTNKENTPVTMLNTGISENNEEKELEIKTHGRLNKNPKIN